MTAEIDALNASDDQLIAANKTLIALADTLAADVDVLQTGGSLSPADALTVQAMKDKIAIALAATVAAATRDARTLGVVPTITGVSVDQTSIVGGGTAQGTVSLSGPAQAGGFAVSLASDVPQVASVPASVTVPAGVSSATFTVSTSLVITTNVVTITAGGTASATLTVTP